MTKQDATFQNSVELVQWCDEYINMSAEISDDEQWNNH